VTEHILLAIIGGLAILIVVMVGWFLTRLDHKLDGLTVKFDGKFDGLSQRLGGVEQGVAGLNGRIDAFGQRLNRIEANGKVAA
jgi:hypothetical protein